jgi:protein gp37
VSKIEWTDRSWNPWWGCNEIAPECGGHGGGPDGSRCYAAVFASRGLRPEHVRTASGGKWTGLITRSSDAVWGAPLSWRKPCRVFTCSMSDFWHENVPETWLGEALDVIEATPHLTYQVLTKRPGNVARKLALLGRALPRNVWLGVSIGHIKSLPLLRPLLRIDAAVRFLSCEPLLTPLPDLPLDGIGWVIVGGQSGRYVGRTDPEWMRSLRDRCAAAGVACFVKQMTRKGPIPDDLMVRQFPSLK